MRAHWESRLGFILATAGSAVGLGNIWRFPYLVGQYGGGAFILLYLLCIAFLGYFILTAKIAFGRAAQSNIIDGFSVTAHAANKTVSPWWGRIGGGLCILNALLVDSVYVVVIGWVLAYFAESVSLVSGISDKNLDASLFTNLTHSLGTQIFCSLICIMGAMFILWHGVKKGIEKASLYMMPILFLLLVFLAIRMLFIPGAMQGLQFLFVPDWTRLGFENGSFNIKTFCDLLLVVLGQAIYSISLGLGVAFIYGSYLPQNSDIKNATKWVVGLDTLVAILAACIVLPAVFAFGLAPAQGPELSFVSLPFVFASLAGGKFIILIFFMLLLLAAMTSLISVYEPIINLIMEKGNCGRKQAILLTAGFNIIGMLLLLISFTGTVPIRVAGMDLFSLFDKLSGSYTMGMLVFVCCLFMGWKIPTVILGNISKGSSTLLSPLFKVYMMLTLKYIAPIILIILFLSSFM